MRMTCISLLIVLGWGGAAALAQDRGRDKRPDPGSKSVDVRILGIRATTKNKDVDPQLSELARELREHGTGFKLDSKGGGSTALGKSVAASFTGGYTATVTPQSLEKGQVTLQVQITKGGQSQPLVSTTVTLRAGRYQIWGFRLADDDKLLIAVSAR
jgi:hypothetical protein